MFVPEEFLAGSLHPARGIGGRLTNLRPHHHAQRDASWTWHGNACRGATVDLTACVRTASIYINSSCALPNVQHQASAKFQVIQSRLRFHQPTSAVSVPDSDCPSTRVTQLPTPPSLRWKPLFLRRRWPAKSVSQPPQGFSRARTTGWASGKPSRTAKYNRGNETTCAVLAWEDARPWRTCRVPEVQCRRWQPLPVSTQAHHTPAHKHWQICKWPSRDSDMTKERHPSLSIVPMALKTPTNLLSFLESQATREETVASVTSLLDGKDDQIMKTFWNVNFKYGPWTLHHPECASVAREFPPPEHSRADAALYFDVDGSADALCTHPTPFPAMIGPVLRHHGWKIAPHQIRHETTGISQLCGTNAKHHLGLRYSRCSRTFMMALAEILRTRSTQSIHSWRRETLEVECSDFDPKSPAPSRDSSQRLRLLQTKLERESEVKRRAAEKAHDHSVSDAMRRENQELSLPLSLSLSGSSVAGACLVKQYGKRRSQTTHCSSPCFPWTIVTCAIPLSRLTEIRARSARRESPCNNREDD